MRSDVQKIFDFFMNGSATPALFILQIYLGQRLAQIH